MATLTSVATDNLALTSDGVKYTTIADGKDRHRDRVVPQEAGDRKCL